MDENRIANTALHGRVEGTPRRGYPRTTFLNQHWQDMKWDPQVLTEIAQDRRRWGLMFTNTTA